MNQLKPRRQKHLLVMHQIKITDYNMTDIKQIADEIYNKEKIQSYRDLINKFEKFKPFFETFDYNSTDENYILYLELISDYGIALSKTKSYKKALPIINQAIDLFRNCKKYSPETLSNVQFYEALLFQRGLSNFHLNNFELAKLDFELLIKLYPDNDVYPKWKNEFKMKRLYRLRNILWYIVLASLSLEIFFKSGSVFKTLLLGIVLLSFISVTIFEIIIYFRKKKFGA
jgi:tetratricopeptide (TPR) repeat protein